MPILKKEIKRSKVLEMEQKKRIFSGMQPSGIMITLGNYLEGTEKLDKAAG